MKSMVYLSIAGIISFPKEQEHHHMEKMNNVGIMGKMKVKKLNVVMNFNAWVH